MQEEKNNEEIKEQVETNSENNKTKIQEKKPKKVKTRAILVLIFIMIMSIFAYVSYRGNYLETIEIGENFKQVFSQNLKYQYATIGINFIILFIVISIANSSIKKGLKAFFDEEKKTMPKLPNKSIAFILSVIASVVISYFMKEPVALFMNKAWFGINDPVFGADIGFYIFEQPFFEMLIIYFIGIIIGLAIYSTFYYIIIFNKYFDGVNAQTLKKSKFFKQLINSVMFLAVGISVYILVTTQGMVNDKFLILNDDNSTAIYGAGVTDVTIKLWGYRLLAVVIIFAAYRAIKGAKEKQSKKVITSILIVPAYMIILFAIMVGFKFIYINTNELDKEKQYLSYNIENTKTAYGIKIDEIDTQNKDISDLDEIEDNSELINNVTLVSEDITLKTIGVTQTSTGYYTYRNTNIGKYSINGKDKIVYISPREILSSGDRTYNNKTYEYTHGFGAVITSSTQTDETGNIKYIQKDFVDENQPIKITQPRIYFGLETNNTIVTNTGNKAEFDYPTTTSQNAEYKYDGNAGLKLNFIDRMIIAIKEGDLNLAFSSNLTDESKILMNRNIITRAKTIMPYLIYDEEPYLVINNEGRLVWVLDAYTVTDKYPYSQYTTIEHDGIKEQINYIRNSVKVLVDAYDGTMNFYITDKSDPIVMAYRNIYPELFMDLDETIPEDISSHFIYPKFLYKVQASILERYHNVSTDVLYRSDDVWEIAKTSNTTTSSSSKGIDQEPYYTMLKAVDEEKYELGLVLQYTQLDKQNLRAYLVGGYDENGNPKLKLYKFSQDSTILGPMQLETLLNQDETISKELDSLNVSGTKTIKNMIAVPINNTVLYLEPIYQISLNEAKSTPVLKKVVVACGTKVAIGDTLEGAIKNLLSQSAVNIEVENTDTIDDLVNAIIKANTNLETSTDNKDWEMIGKDLKKLQELIDKLEKLQEEKEKEEREKNKITGNNVINTTIDNVVNNI